MSPVIPNWIVILAASIIVFVGVLFTAIVAFLAARYLKHR